MSGRRKILRHRKIVKSQPMQLRIGISAIHVRTGASGSHEPYMVNLIRALAELDTSHEFTLFVTRANQRIFKTSGPNFKTITFPRITHNILARVAFEQFVLPLYSYRHRLDVLHYAGTASSLFIRRGDVVTIHHDSHTQRSSMSWLRNLYYDWVLEIDRRAGILITPTQHYANQLCEYFGYSPEQMRAIHHGTNPAFKLQSLDTIQRARENWGIEPGAMMTATNTLPHKNIPNLIRAFELLITRHHINKQLVLIGNVDQEVLKSITARVTEDPLGVHSRLRLIPFLPNDQLPPLFGVASIFLFLSLTETFGMPLTEAMACGLPILASDIPVHREVLAGAGKLVPPTDVEAIANAMYEILTSEKLRDEMRKAALARAKSFSWAEAASKTLQAYEDAYHLSRNKC